MVQSYMERKYGIDLSKPFNLPEQVSSIEMATGYALFHRVPTPRPRTPASN
jgi:hypothetical protein